MKNLSQTLGFPKTALLAHLPMFRATCLILVMSPRSQAVTYSCGNPSSGHCYGIASWQEKPEYFGAYSDILQVPINCPGGCGGFIDDEERDGGEAHGEEGHVV